MLTLNFEPHLSSTKDNWITVEDKELSGNDKLGLMDGSGNFLSLGTVQYDAYTLGSAGYFKRNSTGNVTKNYHVSGTLDVSGNAQVQLGGQLKVSATGTTSYDEFTGLIANNVIVRGNANVSSWNGIINNLTVKENATVNLHTGRGEGNSYFCIQDARDSKQVQIKQNLNVEGGTVTIGRSDYISSTDSKDEKNKNPDTEYHTITTFGSVVFENPSYDLLGGLNDASDATIKSAHLLQNDGTLKIHGKSASVGGLNITQTGGTMNISTEGSANHTWHFLSDYGDSTINQSGNATLNIGGIKAYNSKYDTVLAVLQSKGVSYNMEDGMLSTTAKQVEINPSISITQEGSGSISIIKGIDFTNQKTEAASTEISSISQSGSGTINLSGTYSGVTFDVEQTGSGAIKLNSSMSLNTVTLDDSTATPIAEGKESGLYIGKDAEVTARTLSIDGGKLVNNGKLTVTGAADSTYALRTAAATPINITDGELVNSGTIEGAITMSGGKLVAETGSTIAGISATGGEIEVVGDITMTGNLVMDDAAALIFDDPTATISLKDCNFIFNGGNIAVTLTNEELDDLSQVVLFTNADAETNWGEYEVAIVDENGKTSGKAVLNFTDNATGDVTITVVPEPTSALLSLVGLVAFTLRRRRR